MNTLRISCHQCERVSFSEDIQLTHCPYCHSSDIEKHTVPNSSNLTLSLMGFDKLNEEQRAIVLSTEGLNYVEAGPGTAKSTTLVFRARYLIHYRRDSARQPLILTFTNQAVDQLQDAFLNERPHDRPQVYTLHGFAYRLLLKYRNHLSEPLQHFRIMNEDDWNSIINNLQQRYPADYGTLDVTELKKQIQQQHGTGTCILNTTDTDSLLSRFIQVQISYGLLDFDDLLPLAVELLHNADVLACVNDQYRYVLVDESQDLTDTEFELLNLITLKYRNLFLVGDTDQSIYGWRGAKNHALDWLNSLGLTVHTFSLTLNYRSSQAILNTARTIIEQTPNRTSKTLTAVYPKGVKVMVKECPDPFHEAKIIASSIELATDTKSQPLPLKYSDIAVLVRNHASLKLIRKALIRKKIPVSNNTDTPLLKHSTVRQVIQFLTFLNTPDIYTFSAIGTQLIPDEYWQEITAEIEHAKGSVMDAVNHWDSAGKPMTAQGPLILNRLNNLFYHLSHLKQSTIFSVFETIISLVGTDGMEKELDAFRRLARKLLKKSGCDLSSFLDILAITEKDELEFQHTKNHVHLLTLHAAKGREFKKVFIAGVTSSLIPNPKGDVEEERRLLYVGITRAKEELVFSCYRKSFEHAEEPSPFLNELLQSESVIFCPVESYRKKTVMK